MEQDVTKSLDELKELVATLSTAVKENAGDKEKMNSILADLLKKQEELSTKQKELEEARNRKGVFTEDTKDVKDINSSIIDAMISNKSVDDKVIELQKANDDILIVSQILGKNPEQTKLYKDTISANPFLKKALDTLTSGEGSEWVPTGYSPQLYDKIRLELRVATLHPQIDMPTNPYKPPLVTSDATGYLVAERTGDDDTLTAAYRIPASNVGSSNFTLTAKKIAGRIVFSEELSEDSIVPILPLVKRNIVIAISTAIENAIINGDTASTHQDSDVTGATDARKAWDGYRKLAKSAAKVSLATFNGDNLMSVRKAMGRYGINPADLAIVAGISGYTQLLGIKDSSNNQLVTTIDKYGPGAVILSGELGRIYGLPIIVSEYIRENLNATGVYDATTTTKTIVLIVFKPGFLIGNKRSLMIKTAEDITTDQTILVATQRMAFSGVYTAATDYTVGVGINITS